MEKFILIGAGGFVGANLRYLTQQWAAAIWGPNFPYGTLIANVIGSFVIGLFLTLATELLDLSPNWRYFIATGVLGGYTTFSSFAYETLSLAESGRYGYATLNLVGNVALGLGAALLGIALARLMMR
ncbi:MAG: fluoride efflux transporter CrcB [Anaerolineae bacterium]|jgi:CrcB protein|nr:fluoride efflux transporter CrcB [Anaerolineae bacterium]